MRNIKLTVAYDGTHFSGWQVQSRDRSVQGDLEKALSNLHGRPLALTGAGRTDSGVHASGQVANFFTDKDNIPAHKFREALNSQLAQDVRVLESQEVAASFHSRRDAVVRRYEYRLWAGSPPPPHVAPYVWKLRKMPPLALLDSMAAEIVGIHDFSTFAAARDPSPSKVREVFQAAFIPRGEEVIFRISGNAFLWRMVRSLLGTIVDLSQRGGDAGDMRGILSSRDRFKAGPTAPPTGLFLTKVMYGEDRGVR